jgi:hypothetical protein
MFFGQVDDFLGSAMLNNKLQEQNSTNQGKDWAKKFRVVILKLQYRR